MNLEATEKDSLQFTLLQSIKKIKKSPNPGYKTDADLFKNKQNPKSCVFSLSKYVILRNVLKHLANSCCIKSLKITYAQPIRPASFI